MQRTARQAIAFALRPGAMGGTHFRYTALPRIDLLAAFETLQRSGDEGNRRGGRGRQELHRIARDEEAPVAILEEDRREHDGIPLQSAEAPLRRGDGRTGTKFDRQPAFVR